MQAADIPPVRVDQLTEGGWLVVPFRMRGMTRTVAFIRDNERLVSDGLELCGFVPMQGVGENRVGLVPLHETRPASPVGGRGAGRVGPSQGAPVGPGQGQSQHSALTGRDSKAMSP
ncbi:hypothetical protein ABZ464_33790 [Streptomyces sp. NPDC005820]|uniref:hypothetical protein n=1 Tax=Streptomyces sp. NPDC005820 TaxID=3157069 RepID=UPI0033FF5AAA